MRRPLGASTQMSLEAYQDTVTIRPARAQDVEKLVALWMSMMDVHKGLDPAFRFSANIHQQCRHHMKRAIRDSRMCVRVAETPAGVVGYVLAHLSDRPPIYPVGQYGFISELFVQEAYRRRGIGRSLVDEVLAWFRSVGVTAVELLAAVNNTQGTVFWEAVGFRPFLTMYRLDLAPPPRQ